MDADGSGVEQYTSPLPVRLLFLQRSHAESSEVASPRTISCILGPGGVTEVVASDTTSKIIIYTYCYCYCPTREAHIDEKLTYISPWIDPWIDRSMDRSMGRSMDLLSMDPSMNRSMDRSMTHGPIPWTDPWIDL